MKNVFRIMLIAAVATMFALPAYAQGAAAQTTPSAQDAEAKAKLYQQFLDLIKGGPEQQRQASVVGKEYMSKYPTPVDDADKQILDYIKNWVAKYDVAVRDFELSQSFEKKDYARTYEIGRGILNEQPENVAVALLLARAGYANLAAGGPNIKSLTPEAVRVTRRALELIESGKAPAKWDPFTNRDEAVGFLQYTLGLVLRESSPNEAAAAFIKAAQSNSVFKTQPSTFTLLANVYETGELKRLVDAYNAAFPAGQEIPEERKPQYDQMLAQIGQVQDRVIDAYARAAAVMGNDAKYANDKKAVMAKLTAYYKQRNNDSEAGLNELIASVLSRPLPQPGQPAQPAVSPSAASTTPATTTPATTTPSTTPATTTPATTTPATNPGTKPATTPPANNSTTPTKPRQ
jgi:hypothetical protein